MPRGLVVYATRTNQTQKIAQLIAEGMRFEGYDMEVRNVTEIDKGGISLIDYNAIVLGSATYHGEMLQSMKTLLFLAAKANLEGKSRWGLWRFWMEWRGARAHFRHYDTYSQDESGPGATETESCGSWRRNQNGSGLWAGNSQKGAGVNVAYSSIR